MVELRERSVQPDRRVGAVLERSLDEEDSDENEDDHAREVAEAADPLHPRPRGRAHLLGLRVLQKVLADAAVPLVEADADQHGTCDSDEPGSAGPPEDAGGLPVHVLGAALGAEQDLHGDRAESGIDEAARERGDAVEAAVRSFRAVPEKRADEPPARIAGEADRDEDQEHLTERLVRDRLERPLLARRLSACADRELEGEDPDDPVDQPAGDEAGPGEQLERIAPRDLLTAAASLPELRLAAHRRTDNGRDVKVDTPNPANDVCR